MDQKPKTSRTDELLEHVDLLRNLARALLGDEQRAEDVVQETWLIAARCGPQDTGALRSWLARVTKHLAINKLRSEQRLQRREKHAARLESRTASRLLR